jgi:hypothetical protein
VNDQVAKFFDQTPVPGRTAMGHRINSARCEFTEDGFGAVIHELGHAIGLPHDFSNHDRYIMANGFRQIARNLSPQTRYFGRQAEQKRQLVIHAGGDPLILGRVNYDDANFLQGAFDPRD